MTSSHILGDDHLDLILTAASHWEVLGPASSAPVTGAGPGPGTATASAGRLLRQANLNAVRWLGDRGRGQLADRITPGPYTFTEVDRLDPVEVIKACHAAQAACSAAPGWPASMAKRLLDALVRAATHRLDGYAEAPWLWTRPVRRCGRPIAVARTWRPDLPRVSWVSVDQVRQQWQDAALVVVTTEAATALPPGLPPRSGVFILADRQPHEQVWQAIMALGEQALVMFWPDCQPWLLEQLNHPSAEYVEHRAPRL